MTNVSRLWPAPGIEPVNHWGELAGKLGVVRPPAYILERPLLICLRGVRPFDEATHPMRSVAAYDDTGVFLHYDGAPMVFPMSSHAYQVNSKLSPDVDADGLGDVGTIVPGRYVLKDLHDGKYPTFHVLAADMADRIPCWRDTDHDGIISHDERQRVYSATAILIHGGIDDPPDSPHHYSIGCQCVPLVWRRKLVQHAKGGFIDYILIDAEKAAELVDAPSGPEGVV